jgi:shikimate dehydrogenase
MSDADVYTLSSLKELSASPPPFAVIGHPVAHSLSPAFHLAALRACKLEENYIRIEIKPEELAEAVEAMKSLPLRGWNVTLPHKWAMLELVDEVRESARALGAVNTVLNDEGNLIGWNTDGEGWKRAIREQFSLDIRDLRILIIGAGGAGAALARQAALDRCQRLVIANRTLETAETLARELEQSIHSERLLGADAPVKAIACEAEPLERELDTIDLIVNATSLGLRPADPAVLAEHLIQPHHCVYDTIYKSKPTRLIENARQAGARAADGLSMLLHQGALSFELWTGEDAPLDIMRQALNDALHR